MINNNFNYSVTARGQSQSANSNVSTSSDIKGNAFLSSGLTESKELTNGIMTLVQQLLTLLQKGGQPKPHQQQPLDLSDSQENALRNLLGFTNQAISLTALDKNRDQALSAGDVVVVSGGITGGEITRHKLTQKEVDQINGNLNLPNDLVENRAKWEAASSDGQSVSYTAQNSCFCPPDYTRPMNITEQNGKIVDATYADTVEAVPSYIRDGLLTMSERFDQLEAAYLNDAARIDVSYDQQYGYPSSVYIDESEMIADEETHYTIKDLELG